MAYFDLDKRQAGLLPAATSGSVPPPAGEKYVPEYQVSGQPFLTGSTESLSSFAHRIDFPYMTQWICVSNESDTDMKIGFTETGVTGGNYYVVQASQMTDKLEIRARSLFVKAGGNSKDYSVMAGLTNIPTGSIAQYDASTYWGV